MEQKHTPQYRNPLPVVLLIQPVEGGVLLIRRKGSKRPGMLALPGGYLEVGETWQEGAARELFEESGVRIDVKNISLYDLKSSEDGELLLVFGLAKPIKTVDLSAFQHNFETSERVIVNQPVELAFPLHTAALKRYFESELVALRY